MYGFMLLESIVLKDNGKQNLLMLKSEQNLIQKEDSCQEHSHT